MVYKPFVGFFVDAHNETKTPLPLWQKEKDVLQEKAFFKQTAVLPALRLWRDSGF